MLFSCTEHGGPNEFVCLIYLHLYNLSSILEGKCLISYSNISVPYRLELLAEAKFIKREVWKRKEKLKVFREKLSKKTPNYWKIIFKTSLYIHFLEKAVKNWIDTLREEQKPLKILSIHYAKKAFRQRF